MPAASVILQFIRGQLFTTPSLPNVSFAGKTVIITGANQGLGFQCAKQLIKLNVSTLILGCRDIEKGDAAKRKLMAAVSGKTDLQVWKVDMASYDSVKAFAQKVERELPQVDVLLANAGISTNQFNLAESLEETLTVNVVSTFLLSLLLLPTLRRTAVQTGPPTHLTITGSVVHCFADDSQLQTAQQGSLFSTLSDKNQADMAGRYFLSKLIVLQGIRGMAKSCPNEGASPGVIMNAPNPGWCKTELFRTNDGGFWSRNMLRLIGRTSEEGARTLTSAIAAGEETHGQYLSECQIKRPSAFVRSVEGGRTQAKVWTELLEQLEMISPTVTAVLSAA